MLALYFYSVRIVRTNLSENGIRSSVSDGVVFMNYDCFPVSLFFIVLGKLVLGPQKGGTFTLYTASEGKLARISFEKSGDLFECRMLWKSKDHGRQGNRLWWNLYFIIHGWHIIMRYLPRGYWAFAYLHHFTFIIGMIHLFIYVSEIRSYLPFLRIMGDDIFKRSLKLI